MDIEIETPIATEPVVEDELMEYDDDAAIVVDDTPLEVSASASGEEDTEMDDEPVAVAPELDMSELAPEAEEVVAPEVILADAEVEESEGTEAAVLPVSMPADEATAEVETVEIEAAEVVSVQVELDQKHAAAETSTATETSPSQAMGSDFFDYGHHDGSGDEAIHASGSEYYDEEEHEYNESDALIDILVAFDNIQVPLFSLTEGSEGTDQEALLDGRADELCHAPLAELLAALRSECELNESKKDWIQAGEMCLEEENMGLYVGEDNHHAHSITLAQILDLYRGCQIESPIVLHISFVPDEDRFITRFKAIEREVLAQADKAGLEHDEVDELGGQGVEEEAFEDHEQEEPDQHEQPLVQQEQVAVPLPSDEPAEEGEGDFNDAGRGDVDTEADAELGPEVEAEDQDGEADAGAELDQTAEPEAEDEAEVADEGAKEAAEAEPESADVVAFQHGAVEEVDVAQEVDSETTADQATGENVDPAVPAENATNATTSTEAEPVETGSSAAVEVNQASGALAEAVEISEDADDNDAALPGEQAEALPQEAENVSGPATEAEPSETAATLTEATTEKVSELPKSGADDGLTSSDALRTATVPAVDSVATSVPALPIAAPGASGESVFETEQDGPEDDTFGDESDQYGIDAVVNAAEKQANADDDDDAELEFAGGEVDDQALVGRVEESYEGDDIPEGVDVNDPEDEIASHTSSRTISADEEPASEAADGALALAHSMLPIGEDSAWPEDDAQDDDFYDQENEVEWQDDDHEAEADVLDDANLSVPESTGFVAAAALVETRSRSPKRTLEEDDDGKAEREVRQKR